MRCNNCGRFVGKTHLHIVAELSRPKQTYCNWDCLRKKRTKNYELVKLRVLET